MSAAQNTWSNWHCLLLTSPNGAVKKKSVSAFISVFNTSESNPPNLRVRAEDGGAGGCGGGGGKSAATFSKVSFDCFWEILPHTHRKKKNPHPGICTFIISHNVSAGGNEQGKTVSLRNCLNCEVITQKLPC